MAARKSSGPFPKAFPKGDFAPSHLVAVAGARGLACPTFADDAAVVLLADEPKGRTFALPAAVEIPRRIGHFAATRDGVVVLHPNDEKLHLVSTSGEVRATLAAPWLRHVVTLVPHPSGAELAAIVDEGQAGVPTTAKVLRIALDGTWRTTELETRPYRPAIAFDAEGTLASVDSREARFYASGETEPTKAALGADGPIAPKGLSFAGDRIAFWHATTGGSLLVHARDGERVQEVQGLIAEHAKLVEGGATLLLTAQAAKDRTGSADWVPWPVPEMRDAYVGLLDVATRAPKGKLLPRTKAITPAMAVIEGELVAISTYGRSRKIELFPWSDLVD